MNRTKRKKNSMGLKKEVLEGTVEGEKRRGRIKLVLLLLLLDDLKDVKF